jgi:hypothetical protein
MRTLLQWIFAGFCADLVYLKRHWARKVFPVVLLSAVIICLSSSDCRAYRLWGEKTVSLSVARERCYFHIYELSKPPTGYSLQKVRVVWIARTKYIPLSVSRQAVCLTYHSSASNEDVDVVEMKHTGHDVEKYRFEILGYGYFDIEPKSGESVAFYRCNGTDIILVPYGLPIKDNIHFAHALG